MAYSGINKHTDYFNTKLYTGNGSGGTGITGVGFQPDLLWIKRRSDSNAHHLVDAVRGAGYALYPNMADAPAASQITSLDSDGFTLAGGGAAVNANSSTYASWNWKANGAGSANTDGSINSTVSVNTTAGFSIVSYTGTGANATVGHGLGVAPKMVIVKCTSQSDGWFIYNKDIGAGNYLRLDQTIASSSASTLWNSTDATSSVFSVGTNGGSNGSSRTYIAYCFAEKTGYSKSFSWAANNNNDGVFLYTGFAPSFFMFKTSNNTRDWVIVDNKRVGYNVISKNLRANQPNAESNNDPNGVCDFLSNGIKFRTDSSDFAGTANLIGFAFGQSLVGSNNVPCTAR